MDACLIVIEKARTIGFDTPGDFFRADDGRLTHRGEAAAAPYHCFGVEILDPQRVYEVVQDRFSLFQVWMAAAAGGGSTAWSRTGCGCRPAIRRPWPPSRRG